MLHIGCHLSISKGLTQTINNAIDIKADTFAFFTRNPRGGNSKPYDSDDLENFKKIYQEKSFVKLVAHAPYTMNLCSKDENIRKFAFNMLKEDLDKMESIPNNYYNFHPGSHVGQGVEKGIEFISEALNNSLTSKMTTVVLLETMSGKGSEIGSKFEELREIIDNVKLKDKLGVCLDTCHVNDAGYDIVNNLDGVLEEFDKIIGLEKLKAIHINDSMNPIASHKDRHAPIGEGTIGINAFKIIINNKYLRDLPFILETPHENLSGYAKEIELLRSLYN